MLPTEPYLQQRARWPTEGRHLLAHYDAETVVVYQAYRPSIGLVAAREGRFGAEWSRTRMSWVKPNFLWMMYRCGWATKVDQEVVLALRLKRSGFDTLLASAVPSTYVPELYADRAAWSADVGRSDVRLQWDPDHNPAGHPVERRALQLGLRGAALAHFADEWIVGIEDITAFVREQQAHVAARNLDALVLPRETLYPVTAPAVVNRLGLSAPELPAPEQRHSRT